MGNKLRRTLDCPSPSLLSDYGMSSCQQLYSIRQSSTGIVASRGGGESIGLGFLSSAYF